MIDPAATLSDFATLAFVIAHGADATLDSREVDVLTRRVESLSHSIMDAPISGTDISEVVRHASECYVGLPINAVNSILDRLGRALEPEQRAEVYAAWVEVAAADGTVKTMEQTFLRHIAAAWHLD